MRAARMGCVAAAVAVALLALASAAGASVTPFVWTGDAVGAGWSLAGNWQGAVAPSGSEPVSLEFPRLASCGGTCYASANDVENLNVESIALDDSDEYELGGKAIDLGAGGLTATPAAGSSALDFLELPVKLSAAQTWSLSGRSAGLAENGIALLEQVSGEQALTYQLADEAALYLANETEVGPVAINGTETSGFDFSNGFVALLDGEVNYFDENTVSLSHVAFSGFGAFGALSTNDAQMLIGAGAKPADGIVTDSATFDGASDVGFEIVGNGTTAGEDNSELLSEGQVELGGAEASVEVVAPKTGACPSLQRGQTYTLVATRGSLVGTFANAPENSRAEIEVTFFKACNQPARPMRVEYHRGGAVQTVTGTVEAAAIEKEAEQKTEQEQEAKRRLEEQRHGEELHTKEAEKRQAEAEQNAKEAAANKAAEEATTAKKHTEEEAVAAVGKKHTEEEAASAAAANRKHEEEALAKGGVLGVKENSKPKHHLSRAQLLARALKACKREPPHKRAQCEATAKRRYGARGKKGGHARKG